MQPFVLDGSYTSAAGAQNSRLWAPGASSRGPELPTLGPSGAGVTGWAATEGAGGLDGCIFSVIYYIHINLTANHGFFVGPWTRRLRRPSTAEEHVLGSVSICF